MISFLTVLVQIFLGITLVGVVVVLFTGVVGLARGGDFNNKWSNRLMRVRIGLQLLAVALLGVLMLLKYGMS